MKKLYILLYVMCFATISLWAANPFWLFYDNPKDLHHSPLLYIMEQKPIRFSVLSDNERVCPEEAAIDYMRRGLVYWFEQLQQEITQPEFEAQRKALERYEKAIAFGANPDSYILSRQADANIRVYFMNEDYVHKECKYDKAVACVKNNGKERNKIIFFTYPPLRYQYNKPYIPLVRTVLHELGHVWSLDDLYTDNYGEPRKYGSGVQDSIMNLKKDGLTCDDLDGISNMLYLAARTLNTQEPDFIMPSFCGSRWYKNGKILKSGMDITEKQTYRGYSYYCEDFTKAFTLTFDPLDPTNLLSEKIFTPCSEEITDGLSLAPYKLLSYQEAADLTGLENLPQKEKIFYRPLIQGTTPLNLFIHIGEKIPVYAYILDENKQVIFLFAHFRNGKNWVYNSLFDENKHSAHDGKQIVIYSRQSPNKYTSWWQEHSPALTDFGEQEVFDWDSYQILEYFRNYFPLQSPFSNAKKWDLARVQKVNSWENYLTGEFLQNIEMEKRFRKRLKHLLKQQTYSSKLQ